MTERECGFMCLGVAVGAILGAGIGMLTAPHSGRVTRRRLRRAGEEFEDRLHERGEELVERGRDMADRGREFVNEKRREAERAFETVRA